MGINVKGFIAADKVKLWLENYEVLSSKGGTFETDEIVISNSGPKSSDGVSGRAINKIMLDQAIAQLPAPLKLVVVCRWTKKTSLTKALNAVGVKKSEYYRRCDAALEAVHKLINGQAANYADLYNAISKEINKA